VLAPGPALATGGGAEEAAPVAAVAVETEAVWAGGVVGVGVGVGAGAGAAAGEGTCAVSDALGAVTEGGAFDVSAQATRAAAAAASPAASSERIMERGMDFRVSL
jgi:hypothetical protein